MREAGGFDRMQEDKDFCFFLASFHKIMAHVDMLFNQLQKRNMDCLHDRSHSEVHQQHTSYQAGYVIFHID